MSSRSDPGSAPARCAARALWGVNSGKKYQAPAAAHSGALMCVSAPYPTKSLAFGDIGVCGPSQPQRSSCRHGSHRSRPARSPIIMALGGDRMAWPRAQRPAGKPISHQSSCENRNPVLYRRSSERAHARRAARRGKKTRRKILIWIRPYPIDKSRFRTNKTKQIQAILFGLAWPGLGLLGRTWRIGTSGAMTVEVSLSATSGAAGAGFSGDSLWLRSRNLITRNRARIHCTCRRRCASERLLPRTPCSRCTVLRTSTCTRLALPPSARVVAKAGSLDRMRR